MNKYVLIFYNVYDVAWDYANNQPSYDVSVIGNYPYRLRMRMNNGDYLRQNEEVAACITRLIKEVIENLTKKHNPNECTSYTNLRWYKISLHRVQIEEKIINLGKVVDYYLLKDEFGNKIRL